MSSEGQLWHWYIVLRPLCLLSASTAAHQDSLPPPSCPSRQSPPGKTRESPQQPPSMTGPPLEQRVPQRCPSTVTRSCRPEREGQKSTARLCTGMMCDSDEPPWAELPTSCSRRTLVRVQWIENLSRVAWKHHPGPHSHSLLSQQDGATTYCILRTFQALYWTNHTDSYR